MFKKKKKVGQENSMKNFRARQDVNRLPSPPTATYTTRLSKAKSKQLK